MTATDMDLCAITELPVPQCAHCQGHELDPFPIRWEGSQTEARFPGSCAHCGDRFPEGAEIVLTGDVESGEPDTREWCLLEHTRAAGGLAY